MLWEGNLVSLQIVKGSFLLWQSLESWTSFLCTSWFDVEFLTDVFFQRFSDWSDPPMAVLLRVSEWVTRRLPTRAAQNSWNVNDLDCVCFFFWPVSSRVFVTMKACRYHIHHRSDVIKNCTLVALYECLKLKHIQDICTFALSAQKLKEN